MSISYLLYTTILITLFYCLYALLLRKETFFKANRFILLLGIISSFLIPTIPTPIKISVADTTIESKPFQLSEFTPLESSKSASINYPSVNTLDQATPVSLETNTSSSRIKIIPVIYLLGVLILFVNILIQLLKVFYSINKHKKEDNIIQLPFEASPYSFFSYVFIGKHQYEVKTLNQIIEHEKIHSIQKHTYDIILAELLIVIQWFNPFAWLYRRAVERNLEFIVDQQMLDLVDTKKEYQYNLLNLAVKNYPLSVVTHYNQSLIKTRIKMMNTKKSSTSKSWKYLLFIPILLLTTFLFNPSKLSSIASNVTPAENLLFVITANASWDDLMNLKDLTKQNGLTIEFSDLVWDHNKTLDKIKVKLSSGLSIIAEFNDINKHKPIIMYTCPDGNYGLVNEAALSDELLLMPLENTQDFCPTTNDKIAVLSSFSKMTKDLDDFLISQEYIDQKLKFDKEQKWEEIFDADMQNGSNQFHYILDGAEIKSIDLVDKLEVRDIQNIEVMEVPPGKSIMRFTSDAFTGYQMVAATIAFYDNEYSFKGFIKKEHKRIIESRNADETKIAFLLNGVETKNILEKLDSTKFDKLYIEHGKNFDTDGNFLGDEIKFNHLQRD